MLEEDDPELLASLDAQKQREQDIKYPKPELSDLLNLHVSMQAEWADFWEWVNENQDLRYQRDETPQKWKRHLEGDRRVRSRLMHNEILRATANQCRNPYRVDVQPSGTDDGAVKRAKKQTRWCNGLIDAFERKAGKALRRPFVDAQNSDGLVAWELCRTDAYDGIDFDYQDVTDEENGSIVTRKERDSEYVKRTEREILAAGMPYTLRMVNALALMYREDDEGVCEAMIHEYKPYRKVYSSLMKRKSTDELQALSLPLPGTRGWPVQQGSTDAFANDAGGVVETIRYYDRRWYAYIVGGVLIELEEHGWSRVPVFPCQGIPTSSPNLPERHEGITWGMAGLELAMNDHLTLGIDVAYTYSRPKLAVITDKDGDIVVDPATKKPVTLDLSNPSKVPQLARGQNVVNVLQGWKPELNDSVINTLMMLYTRNGMNPVAQGQSPGSDPAGYTVNTLIGAAQSQYEVCLDNEARTWAAVCDAVRKDIRDSEHGERVYISVPMEDKRDGGVEWLGLGPDDVDETPCTVTIDPLSDANRMAERQSLLQGWQAGMVPKSVVQTRGFGADDPMVWDDMRTREDILATLKPLVLQSVMQRYQMMQPPAPPPPGAQPQDMGGGQETGATPAKPQPPTVGKEANAASQGPIPGQSNGYNPPPGNATPSEAR